MKLKFMDTVKCKSKLRRTETVLRGAFNRKEWVIDRFKHPQEGTIIGFRNLSDGESEYCQDDPIVYHPKRYFKALLVIFNEVENPVYVLPEEAFY